MKKAIFVFLLMTALIFSARAVDTGNITNTPENFTVYFANGGTFQFNYPGNKNATFNETQGWINITNTSTVTVLYNISAGQNWALYQDPATCSIPYEDITPTVNTSLCTGKYYFYDLGGNGVLYLNTNNVAIQGNNATFYGNKTTNSMGIKIGARSGLIVNNLTILDYYYGVAEITSTAANNSFTNLYIRGGNVGFYTFGYQNISVSSSTFDNASIYLSGSKNTTISNNSWVNCDIHTCGGSRAENIRLDGGGNVNIYNNKLDFAEVGLYVFSNTTYLDFYNNTISNHDRGIKISSGGSIQQINIFDNFFDNNTNSYDTYLLDIFILESANIKIYNNTFNQSVDVSIVGQNTRNIEIKNNTFNLVCIQNRSLYNANAQNEPCAAIKFGQTYKTWNYICPYQYATACVLNTFNDNINISGNIFNNETNTFVHLQGASNVSLSLPSYWYRSFEWYNFLGRTELYINSNYSVVRNKNQQISSTKINNLYDAYSLGSGVGYFRWYGWNKTNGLFWNSNNASINVSVYNLTAPYNDIMNRSNNRVIAVGVPNYTITLPPNGQIEVGSFTYCGDGIYQALDDEGIAEQCDLTDLNAATCRTNGYDSGALACSATCSFNETSCAYNTVCRNNLSMLDGVNNIVMLGGAILILVTIVIFLSISNLGNVIGLNQSFGANFLLMMGWFIVVVALILGAAAVMFGSFCT